MIAPGTVAICITGWHYSPTFYASIEPLRQHELFVVSHKPSNAIPTHVYEPISLDNLFVEPNIGYDRGSYQQFIGTDRWRNYEYLFFMHDDLEIRNLDFVEATIALLDEGYALVGNGKNSTKVDWPRTHLACYTHSDWIPPSINFEHDTVRGSFFALKSNTLTAMQKLEIHWDPHLVSIRFGNHSLIASCGKLQHLCGNHGSNQVFAFLGNEYLQSTYLVEEERGGGSDPPVTLRKRLLTESYIALGKKYMRRRMKNRSQQNDPVTSALRFLLRQIHGVQAGPLK